MIITDYGFNYSATNQISIYREKKERVNEIISTVFCIKSFFVLFSILCIALFIHFVPTVQNVKRPLIYYLPVLIGQAFFPIFAFQGFEKMKLMTIINVTAKFIFLFTLVSLIQGPSDFLTYPLLLSIAEMIRLAIGLYFLKKIAHFSFVLPSKKQILYQLKEGFAIFSSMLSINFYSRLPSIFLGFFAGPAFVGIYSSSIRIVRSTLGLIDPLTQALFPFASRKIHQEKSTGQYFVFQSMKYSALTALVLGVIYFTFASPILKYMAGSILPQSLQILRLHSFLPLIIVISNLVGIQLLIPLGKRKEYSLTMFYTSLLALALLWIFTPLYQAFGAALAIFIAELFATILMLTFFKRSQMQKLEEF